jgi:hypothetical protein
MAEYEKLSGTIKLGLEKLQCVLEETRVDYAENADEFYAKKIFKLGRFIRLYADLMIHLDVLIGDEVEEALSDYDLDKVHGDFLQNWDSFLSEIEHSANFTPNNVQNVEKDSRFFENDTDFLQIKNESHQNISLLDLHKNYLRNNINFINSKRPSTMLLVMLRHFAW